MNRLRLRDGKSRVTTTFKQANAHAAMVFEVDHSIRPYPDFCGKNSLVFARYPLFGWKDFFFSRHLYRLPRSELVLFCREAWRVRRKRSIHRLVIARRKVCVEIRFHRPWLAIDVRGHVERLLIGQHCGGVGNTTGHIALDKARSQANARHTGTVVVAVSTP